MSSHLVPQCATWGFRNIYLNPNRAWTLVPRCSPKNHSAWCWFFCARFTEVYQPDLVMDVKLFTFSKWGAAEPQKNILRYPKKIFETKKVWQTSPLAHWPWEVQSAGIPLSPLRHRDRIQQASTWRSWKGCLRTMSFPSRWSVKGFRRPLFESWT